MASRKKYTKEQMAKAIEEVRKGEKISTAATRYGVPRITLRNKITGKSPIDRNPGPTTVLTHEEENLLVRWIFFMAGKHFPVTKEQLLDSVQKIIADKNLGSCPFSNNRPGKKWYASFLKRHPDLSERAAQNLSKAREDVREEDILSWFEVINSYIENKDLRVAINDPKRIFNADESAFYLQPKAGRVIVRKGEKNVYTASGDEKENLTVLVTGNAAGVLAPPMIVYPYERLPAVIANSVPKDWCIGRSDSGWMCAKTFFEYITNVFNPWIEKNHIPKPVILFLDGHRSHMTLHLSDFCKDNGIEIIALYPNSTHLLQPMDVAVFRPLKVSWKNQVKSWKMENPKQIMKKEHFAPNLEAALQNITADTIKNGFRKSGLFPFGPEYVDMDKLSSQNRATVTTSALEKKIDTAKQFMNTLDFEIRTLFSNEKLNLFTSLYYMPRAEIENMLPNEDLSLYTIWAKTKHFLAENSPQTFAATISDRIPEMIEPIPEMLGTENIQPSDFRPTTLNVCTENNAIDGDNTDLESNMQLSKTVPKDIPFSAMYTTPNKAQTSAAGNIISNFRPTTSNVCTENNAIDGDNTDLESNMQLSKTVPKDIPFSAMYTTPNKAQTSAAGNIISNFRQTTSNGTENNAIDGDNTDLESNMQLSKTVPKDIPFSAMYTTPNKAQTSAAGNIISNFRPTTSNVCTENNAIDGDNTDLESNMQLPKTVSKDIPFSAIYTTPNKAQTSAAGNIIPKPLPLKSQNLMEENIPSPFKRALFWPEPETKKRRTKERIPSAITGEAWRSYVIKKENEKKQKEEQKNKRIKERQEKQLLKKKIAEEKKITNKGKSSKTTNRKSKRRESSSTSSEENRTDIQYQESDQDLELSTDDQIDQPDHRTESEETDEDDIPLAALQLPKKNTFVIIKYEGEYFPGLIKNFDDNSYEISTMVLSKSNTFRWPETPDQIWYNKEAIIEKIQEPQIFNKRGFYKVPEMQKYLPFLCE